MENIKAIILCSGRFALPSMRDMYYANQLGAVCIPAYCLELLEEVQYLLNGSQIPVLQLGKDDFEETINAAVIKHNINLGFVLTFPYRISASLNDSIPAGFFNVHPGPLPEYRGADPIFQQIKNREKFAGVTIHKLSYKMDAGDIVLKELIKIDKWDNYGLLNNKLAELAAKSIGTIIHLLQLDIKIPSRRQDESKARYYKRQTSADVIIKWNDMNADEIIALINACNPWNKGAVTKFNNKLIRIISAKEVNANIESNPLKPGMVASIKLEGVYVGTLNKGLILLEFLYIDEGFFNAAKLETFLLFKGGMFQSE